MLMTSPKQMTEGWLLSTEEFWLDVPAVPLELLESTRLEVLGVLEFPATKNEISQNQQETYYRNPPSLEPPAASELDESSK